ncbi:uncharacterized protein LOC115406934 [Salarias fasciatus]|uniref:Uncharacterized LOC115406934 n=1 Tax=Salarias fasciatus TaxID=181472 RepID=A0A672F6K2_SALFA|nr:uncharacterized protein LOC115406934 [Salarias fasciatus]
MPQCCVPQCFNRSETKGITQLSFYRFPADDQKKKRWLKLIRRDNFTPNHNARVCSWHFPQGKAAGPSRFAWNEGKLFPACFSPEPKRKKKEMVPLPASGEDEDSDDLKPHNTDSASAPEIPRTSAHTLRASVVVLEIENEMLRHENEALKKQLEKQTQSFSFSQISSCPEKVQHFTGLPDAETVLFLEALLSRFELKYHCDWIPSMPLVDQLLLTLMKLRINPGRIDLATRFNCSKATVTNVFITVVCALYDVLYVGMLENNIPSLTKNETSLPDCFRNFPNCRIVLDCTEVATYKTLVGVAPNGVITFVSDLYGGSTSDKAITEDCKVLQHLEPGDMVMAGKGFTVQDILPEGVSLITPSFVVHGQFTEEEMNKNRLISCARIRVERAIQRLKSFRILNVISHQYRENRNKILKVCVCLTNLQTPSLLEMA